MELLLGCGHKRDKRLWVPGTQQGWTDLVTLDCDSNCKPDLVCDLTQYPWTMLSRVDLTRTILESSRFDEVHAYEVLEHLGSQGNAISFFDTFNEIGRILKPGGYLAATTPSRYSAWLWGDPGHTRAILPESLIFLSRQAYAEQCGKTAMSDYTDMLATDWKILRTEDDKTTHRFILQKIA